jgi:diguanylate cyclase (GGDEF)-like protein
MDTRKNFITALGVAPVTILVTLAIVVASLLFTSIALFLHDGAVTRFSLFLAALAPAIIAPPIIVMFARLLVRIARMEEHMRDLATYDALTGLLSRHAIFEKAQALVDVALRSEAPLGVLFLDMDHFKDVNDTYGHETGDRVLQETALLIEAVKRKSDLAGRLGGEEFLVVLPETDASGAERMAEKLRLAVGEQRFRTEGSSFSVTVSIGASILEPWGPEDLDALITRADTAMYVSKANGRNRVTMSRANAVRPGFGEP